MRLSQQEVQSILRNVQKNMGTIPSSIYLFGSRLSDSKRGGDIDLVILVLSEHYSESILKKLNLKFDLELAMGDQRVDITIATKEKILEDPFLASITDEWICLNPCI